MARECPAESDLLAFHLGTLADDEIEEVAEHLESCKACDAALRRLEADADPLLAGLRGSRTPCSEAFDLEGRREAADAGLHEQAEGRALPELPGYEILGVLGRGGMGVVYQARQLALNRVVALKRLRSTSRKEALRARVEAEALGRLQHAYIVQIHEVLEHEGRIYLALEFVAGGSLQAQLAGKPQPCEAAARLIELAARGVHHAHQNDIVHRDLKPANILLARGEQESEACEKDRDARTSSYGLPKIADFGVAKWLAAEAGQTEHGDVLGTATYMAPEQAAGDLAQIGPASDIYSLGVVLYEMLAGRVPLQGTTTLETLALVRGEEPVSPRLLQPHIPRDLETICLKCLEKEPASRYRTAADLADDLARFLNHEPIRARRTAFWERGLKWARRRPAVAALSVALALTALSGVAGIAWEWRRAEEQAVAELAARKRAEENERKVERLSARMMLDRAAALCEAGEIRRGLLWMVEALEAGERAGDADLARVARLNLSAWRPFLLRERARCSRAGVAAIAFDPSGKTLLAGGPDGQARPWNLLDGESAGPPLAHGGPIHALAYSSDGRLVLTGAAAEGDRGQARLFEAATGRTLFPPLSHSGPVSQIAFCDGDRKFVTVCPDAVRLWRVADGQPVGSAMKHEPLPADAHAPRRPLKAVVSPDGKLIATGGSDWMVRIWNASTAEPLGEALEATHVVVALAFSPDSKIILAGGVDGGVRMWDVASGQRRGESLKMRGLVHVVAFSPDGQLAAAAGAVGDLHLEPSGEVQLCQVETGQNLGGALAHPRPVHSLAFSPGGRLLLTGCEDGQARLYVTSTALPVGKPLVHPGPVTAAAFSPEGAAAVTAIADGKGDACLRFWQLPDERAFGRPLTLPGELVTVGFSADGQTLVADRREEPARRWKLSGDESQDALSRRDLSAAESPSEARGRSTLRPGTRGGPAVYSPNRSLSLEASATQMPHLRDAATGETIGPPLGRDDVCCVAFSPDGSHLAAGGFDGMISLWENWSPLGGPAEVVRLEIELRTGSELVAHEDIRPLSEDALKQRRRRLKALRGQPSGAD